MRKFGGKFTLFLVITGLLLLAACTPLRRGFDGNALVSPARPSFSVGPCPDLPLPLLAAGQIRPFVYTSSGHALPETLVAVYGTTEKAPLAVSVLSLVPDDIWTWDFPSYSYRDGPVSSRVDLGGEVFSGSLHVIEGEKDAFTLVVCGGDEEKRKAVRWLAQRYSRLFFFRQAKLILEYREPLPASLEGLVPGEVVPIWNEDVKAFQARAEAVFCLRTPYEGPPVQSAPYIKVLDGKVLGSYLGSLSRNPLKWYLDE